MEATPRPWRIAPETRPQSDRGLTFVETTPDDDSADGEIICTLHTRADAELIVRAVNRHDQLVAALDGMIEAYDRVLFCQPGQTDHTAVKEARRLVALIKAEAL